MSEDEILDEALKPIHEIIDNSIAWSTVPIVHRNSGKLCDLRSGVLLQVGTCKFLVTAGHKMDAHFNSNRLPEIAMPEKGLASIVLEKELFHVTKDSKEDLCVCELCPETITQLGDYFRFVQLQDFISYSSLKSKTGLYLIYGFPNMMGVKEPDGTKRAETWRYTTLPYTGDLKNVENYDSEIHILLEYNRDAKNKDGKRITPHGLSGGGVWFFETQVDGFPSLRMERKLAGIQTGWHPDHEYAKATAIDVVAIILWKYYSDIRDVMKFHGMEF